MRIGTSTDVIRNLDFDEKLKLISDIGYEVAEVWMGDIYNNNLTVQEAAKILNRYNLEYTIHADIRDVNLTSSNKGIAKESLNQMLETLSFAKEVGINIVTMHPGRTSSSKDFAADFWDRQIEVFKTITDKAQELEVYVGIENMEYRKKEFVVEYDSVKRLIDSIANPYATFTLDISHVRTFTDDVAGYLKNTDVHISNVHVSQGIDGKAHLPFYAQNEGLIDMKNIFKALTVKNYSGAIINESYDKDDPVKALKEAYTYLKYVQGEIS